MDNEKWKNTPEGRMSIYFLSITLVDSLRENAYIENKDAEIIDDMKIIDFLRQLVITEWIGD